MSAVSSLPVPISSLPLWPSAVRGTKVKLEAGQDQLGAYFMRFEMEDRGGKAPAGTYHWIPADGCMVRIGRAIHLGDGQPKEPTCRLFFRRFELPITRAEAHDILSVFGDYGIRVEDRSGGVSSVTQAAPSEEQRRIWRDQKRAQRATRRDDAGQQSHESQQSDADDGETTIRIPR